MQQAQRLGRRSVFRGKILDLSVDEVRLPNGQVCEMELARHPGAAAVVPLDRQNNVLLVRQYRYATGEWLLEIPAGKLDSGEAPRDCAVREVEEETGHRAAELLPLGQIWTAPGFTDEKIWLFLARQLEATRQKLERDEVLEVVRLPLSEAIERATTGEICDAKSICALLRVARLDLA